MQRSMHGVLPKVLLALALVFGLGALTSVPQAHASSSYTINYHLNGGSNPFSQYRSVAAGKTIKVSQLKKPTKTGYTFKGWYKNSKLTTAAKVVKGTASSANRTLYAKWAAVSYKIIYKLDGGTQAKGQKTSYTIATSTFVLKAPTKDGYKFLGWCKSSNLSNDSIITKVKKGSTGKLTLYAKWKKVWNGDVNIAGVSVKDSVDDYSWSELAMLSEAIVESETQENALKIAANYHLCSAAGKLTGNETKSVTLNAGTSQELKTKVQIAGFLHDTIDEDNVAGITFIFCDALEMSKNYTGLWATSAQRSSLAGTIFNSLPTDLSQQIVAVQKLTNNEVTKYPVTTLDGVTATTDKLWLYSARELTGEIPSRNWAGNPDGLFIYSGSETAVYNAEGEQYQLFKDLGVTANTPCAGLARTYNGEKVSWYLRSSDPEYSYFAYVNATEFPSTFDPSQSYKADLVIGGFQNSQVKGIVPGFCI